MQVFHTTIWLYRLAIFKLVSPDIIAGSAVHFIQFLVRRFGHASVLQFMAFADFKRLKNYI